MLGLNKGEVKLVSHVTDWAKDFIQEKELLSETIGMHIVDIEHMGSTAISGIVAKPLLDILVGVRSMEDVAKFDKHKLKEAGYYHLGRVEIEGKVVYAKFTNLEDLTKTHVLHIVEYGGDWWQKHTFFRDYLNEHPYVAKQYEMLKKELAATYPDNEGLYTEGKLSFVDDVLSRKKPGPFIINVGNLQVRELERVDKVLLSKWLSDPEILQYYEGRDNPFNIEKVEQEFFDVEENVTRCLVELSGIPIGYVQLYIVDGEEREVYGFSDSAELIYGMDQFIGESAYWNKGIGTELVQAMVKYLLEEKGADRIVMDPQIWNVRAIHCYEKCGFEKVKLLPANELHEGEYRDSWLMEKRKVEKVEGSPLMNFRKLSKHEAPPMDLLLFADPSWELIERYIANGECRVAEEAGEIIGVYVLIKLSDTTMEIINIAVDEQKQGQGVGKELIRDAIQTAKMLGCETLEVGTGNSSIDQLAFYQKCGFRMEAIIKDFFVDNYEGEIFENGIQCRDMIRFSMDIS